MLTGVFHTIEASQIRIQERLGVLRDTFGGSDRRVKQVEERLAELTEDETLSSWQIASLYVSWATQYPEEITRVSTYPCSCQEGRGWVFEHDESGRTTETRPCSRCNQEAFQFLYEQGGRQVARSSGYDDEPPVPDQPPWDDL